MIVIIDYDMGNVGSILNMVKKVGGKAIISSERSDIENAKKLILPGVGAFDHGIENLKRKHLLEVLNRKVVDEKTPILGICLGMQLMTKSSEEGKLQGLGWLEAETHKFVFTSDKNLKIPHMGWNSIQIKKNSSILEGMYENPRFYFVHSYYVNCLDATDVLATTHYGQEFTSAFQRNNIIGMQYHPEKSHKYGMKIIKNFVEL